MLRVGGRRGRWAGDAGGQREDLVLPEKMDHHGVAHVLLLQHLGAGGNAAKGNNNKK